MSSRFIDHMLTGLIADRPAATAVPAGALYSASDEGVVYQSDGSSWDEWAESGVAASAALAAHLADTTDAHDASAVSFAPTGTVAATNVQTAIAEVATEAAAASGIPPTLLDAKGDLIAASANDTAARLPVGSNDQVLVADSTQTLGLKWAAVPGTSAFVPVSTIDAKGDLIVGSANDALARLPVGSNTQVLTADSSQTLGVKWAAAAGGGDPFTTVTKAADESVASSTVVQNDDELFFATVSGGFYEIYAYIIYGSPVGGSTPDMRVAFGEDSNTTRGLMNSLCWNTTDTATFSAVPFTTNNDSASFIAGTQAANRVVFASGFHQGNGGTFRFVWAQNTSSANATIVRAGSQLRYRRVV